MPDKPGIVLGVPCLDENHHSSITRVAMEIAKAGYPLIFLAPSHTLVDWARNHIVRQGEKDFQGVYGQSPDYYFFVDADTVFREPWKGTEFLDSMIARDKDIVGALYLTKFRPHKLSFGWFDADPHTFKAGDFVRTEYTGMGSTLIKAGVFKTIEDPWFAMRAHKEGTVGEDIVFCARAIKEGAEVWIDTALPVGHWGATLFPTFPERGEITIQNADRKVKHPIRG